MEKEIDECDSKTPRCALTLTDGYLAPWRRVRSILHIPEGSAGAHFY
jgi:hypothetical protein